MSVDSTFKARVPSRGFIACAIAVGLIIVAIGIGLLAAGSDLPTSLSATASVGVLLVAVLALWFTGSQLVASRQANHLVSEAQTAAATQAERDSRAAVRPYVYAQLVPGLWGARSCDLRIENLGQTPARDLTIGTSYWPDDENVAADLREFCGFPRSLPPRATHRLLWYDGRSIKNDRFEQGETVLFTLDYRDDNGGRWSEEYQSSIRAMQVEPVPTAGEMIQGDTCEKALKNINLGLRELNVHVGFLRR